MTAAVISAFLLGFMAGAFTLVGIVTLWNRWEGRA